jgi:hypothetical protein
MAAPRRLLLILAGIVAYAAVVSVVATSVWNRPVDNPTCRQLQEDARTERRAVIDLTKQLERPPHVSRAEVWTLAQDSLARACDEAREGRRRPLDADLRGAANQRLRELTTTRGEP